MPQPQLGTSQIGTELLGVDVTYIGLLPTDGTATTSQLTSDAGAEAGTVTVAGIATTDKLGSKGGAKATTTTIQATGTAGQMPPVVLNPDNLDTSYDESRGAFVSEWFVEDTPVPEDTDRDVAITADVDSGDAVSVILERDDTGDGTVDAQSDVYETGAGLVTPLLIDGIEGSRYRVVFPSYARDDDVDSVRVALTWANEVEVEDNWPLTGVATDRGFVGDILDTFASELYALDTRIDEEYDDRFLDTASGDVLDVHGAPVSVNRRGSESDNDLRYRIGVEYAIRFSDGTLSTLETVLERLLDDPSTVSLAVPQDKPMLEVSIPQTQLDQIPFTASEVETKLHRAQPSSYGVTVVVT